MAENAAIMSLRKLKTAEILLYFLSVKKGKKMCRKRPKETTNKNVQKVSLLLSTLCLKTVDKSS